MRVEDLSDPRGYRYEDDDSVFVSEHTTASFTLTSANWNGDYRFSLYGDVTENTNTRVWLEVTVTCEAAGGGACADTYRTPFEYSLGEGFVESSFLALEVTWNGRME